MTRIYREGFEMGDLLSGLASGTPLPTASTTIARSGVYSLSIANTNSIFQVNVTATAEAFFRQSLYTLASGAFFRWYKGATELGSVRINAATRFIEIYTGTGTLVGTGAIAIAINTHFLIETYVKISDTVGVITVKVDGVQTVTFSGDTKPGSDTQFDNVQWRVGTSAQSYVDDIGINDTNGAVDNSWLGDGRIVALIPNADGDKSQLVNSAGNSIANYSYIDETPSDGDTSYVQGSVVNEEDLNNLAASGLINAGILRVWAEARCKDTVAAGGLISLVVKTNSVEYAGVDRALAISYASVLGDDLPLNPNTAAAWTITELDALQIGPKTRS